MRFALFVFLFFFPAFTLAKVFHPEVTAILEKDRVWTEAFFKDNSGTVVMEFRVWFEDPPEKVFEVITDTHQLKTRLSNYTDSRTLTKNLYQKIIEAHPKTAEEVVQQIGPNHIDSFHNRKKGENWTDYMFLAFNFPWPLENRWVVQRVKIDETNATQGEYRFEYEMGAGHFKTLRGYWELLPVAGHAGRTEFRGRYESDPGVPLPRFVTRNAIKLGFKKDVEGHRKVLGTRPKTPSRNGPVSAP